LLKVRLEPARLDSKEAGLPALRILKFKRVPRPALTKGVRPNEFVWRSTKTAGDELCGSDTESRPVSRSQRFSTPAPVVSKEMLTGTLYGVKRALTVPAPGKM